MNKRTLQAIWRYIKPVKVWYLLVVCLVFATIAALCLRDNFTTMTEKRQVVFDADKSGQNVEAALQDLRAYVNAHMNTDLSSGITIYPPIHLQYTYERLKQAEQDRVNAENARIYSDAQAECERLYPQSFSGGPRVPCIENYVKSHGTTAKTIPAALYKFDFASPRWSPDLAGWSLALAIFFLALTIIRFILGRIFKVVVR